MNLLKLKECRISDIEMYIIKCFDDLVVSCEDDHYRYYFQVNQELLLFKYSLLSNNLYYTYTIYENIRYLYNLDQIDKAINEYIGKIYNLDVNMTIPFDF